MPPKCSICIHAQRSEIDRVLLDDSASLRDIAGRFQLSRSALSRHRKEHLAERMSEIAVRNADADVRTAIDVVGELRRVNDAATHVLSDALEAGDGGLTLQATDRILRQVEVQSRLIGLLNDGSVTQIAVTVGAEWPAIRVALIRALGPYPEARTAVVNALDGIEEGT